MSVSDLCQDPVGNHQNSSVYDGIQPDPICCKNKGKTYILQRDRWWAWPDLNQRPNRYERLDYW